MRVVHVGCGAEVGSYTGPFETGASVVPADFTWIDGVPSTFEDANQLHRVCPKCGGPINRLIPMTNAAEFVVVLP